jgi:hypothetical protein
MKKKLYNTPLIEVEQINLTGMLMESPVIQSNPLPPSGPAGIPERKHWTEVF